jgi:chaperonin GroEL (HSP60 family)
MLVYAAGHGIERTPPRPLQVLVDLANLQDSEVGDGTTSVVILAAELLKNAGELVRQKVWPSLPHAIRRGGHD